MTPWFPSFGTMVAFDIAFVLAAVAATLVTAWNWGRIRAAGAALGVVLINLGIWIAVAVYVVDLYDMIVLPRFVGQEAAMEAMLRLHQSASWYASAASVAMILSGLAVLIGQVQLQFRVQADLLAEAQESESRLSAAARLAKLGYYIYDTAAERVIFCTEQHATSHGLPVDEYIEVASTLTNGMPLIHPDDRAMALRKYRALRAGSPIELEYRVPTANGLKRVREIATPIFGQDGQVVREIGTSQDVTDQREIEARLNQSVKTEAIGDLSAGIAHDFNNLLAVILGNLELAKEMPEALDELLDEAIAATQRGAELTRNMLSFARRAPLDPAVFNLNEVVRETRAWAIRALPPRIEVAIDLSDGLWPIRADRAATESALVNLVLNARDAMPDGGTLRIATEGVEIRRGTAVTDAPDLVPGRYVSLTIRDTGEGIEPALIDRIFDPFFTTKPPGKGTGLGLSMIQGFMKQTGGTTEVQSEPGEGTTFRLYFPAEPDLPLPAGRDAPQGGAARQSGTILVVEDEPALSTVIVAALERAGYRVATAASGDAAHAAFDGLGGVDLVLSDVVMPGMLQGPELVAALRRRDPDLPAILMSGHPLEAEDGARDPGAADLLLIKPVASQDLLSAVRSALNVRAVRARDPAGDAAEAQSPRRAATTSRMPSSGT